MKRYGNLYAKVCTLENIRLAHKNARKGKLKYAEVKWVDAHLDECVAQIQKMLVEKTYTTSPYRVFDKVDNGKRRVIYALPYFPDRIIHHCIMQVVEDIWMRTFIRDTYASMKNRGVHDGVRRVQSAMRNDPAGTRYCLKMDVTQFYPSISHPLLKQTIRLKIKDPDLLALMDGIIDSVPSGVPIGNYLSQFLGNLFLSGIDHWGKEVLGLKYYFRYCDDIVVLLDDPTRLHQLRSLFDTELAAIDLSLKGNWQVFPVAARGVDFLGYRFFGTHTLVRRRIADKFRRQMRQHRKAWHRKAPAAVLSSIMSYHGWMRFAQAKSLFSHHVSKPLRQRVITRTGRYTLEGAFQ